MRLRAQVAVHTGGVAIVSLDDVDDVDSVDQHDEPGPYDEPGRYDDRPFALAS
ncbi:hypothetical protein P9139_11945 [Curtobacterium flaccumfaciens]|nr:hypothetical protein P9139_11945 [Curtobacterium flaccumfaciens]